MEKMDMIINGRRIARGVEREVAEGVERLRERGIVVHLTAIMIGKNPASEVYLRVRRRACERVGIASETVHFSAQVPEGELIKKIEALNEDPKVHAVLLQTPLPEHLNFSRIIAHLDPKKDVEGLTPSNYGKLILGDETLAPCTPAGIITMLDHENVEYEGCEVVIIKHSPIVGKPLSLMMLNRNATTHVCHVFTKNLTQHTKKADVLIVGAGVPHLIKAEMVKKGAVVVDVGMNRTENGLRGDVDFDGVSAVAKKITPVPGGVGPMTVALLLKNTLTCAKLLHP